MTTPERLRRRQRIEGTFIALIGIFLVLSSLYSRHQYSTQRDCMAVNFGQLTDSLTARADLAAREAKVSRLESEATRLESRANNQFYKRAFAATDRSAVFAAYGKYRVRMAEVADMRATVDRRRLHLSAKRDANPIPAFPAGTCE
jgi:hypothetical protein